MRALAIAAVTLLLGIFAGSGGGADNKSGSTTSAATTAGSEEGTVLEGTEVANKTIPKAVFLERGNAICAKDAKAIKAKIATAFRTSEKVPGFKREAEELDTTETILAYGLREEQHELQALGAPAGEEEQVRAIIVAIDRNLDKVELNPLWASRSDNPYVEAEAATGPYGLTECPYG